MDFYDCSMKFYDFLCSTHDFLCFFLSMKPVNKNAPGATGRIIFVPCIRLLSTNKMCQNGVTMAFQFQNPCAAVLIGDRQMLPWQMKRMRIMAKSTSFCLISSCNQVFYCILFTSCFWKNGRFLPVFATALPGSVILSEYR